MHNNPVNFNDPTGHLRCDADGYCGYNQGGGGNSNSNGGGGGAGHVGGLGGGNDDEEKPDDDLITDKDNSYGICIAGGFLNPEGSDSGTGALCQSLVQENKISDFTIGNSYTNWYSFYTNNSELFVDYNLVIVGYSNGGPAALELAYYLDSIDRDVSHLFLIDPVTPGVDHRAIPGNVQNSYLLLEDGKETGIDFVADWATHNNYVNGVDYITHITNANHGNVDELSIDIILSLLP